MVIRRSTRMYSFFFFNDTATTEIYTLSLHDALPISRAVAVRRDVRRHQAGGGGEHRAHLPGELSEPGRSDHDRSEEHTSELQSQSNLVCRLLLEKKKKTSNGPVRIPPYLPAPARLKH